MYLHIHDRLYRIVIPALLLMQPAMVSAQSIEPATGNAQTVVDNSPLANARASGMGGAVSPITDSAGAAYFNPAAIGGLEPSGKHFVRQLHFPYVGMSYNENSRGLYDDFERSGAKSDPLIGNAVMNAHGGKRQYARISFSPNIVFGRTMLGGIIDQQLAAVPTGSDGLVETHYVRNTGVVAGTSIADPQGRLFLGVSAAMINRTDVAGNFLYSDMVDRDRRGAVIKDYTQQYTATPINAGIIWRLSPKFNPAISFAVRDLGGTLYSNGSGGDDLTVEEDMTLGFGLSPTLGKWGRFNLVLEGGRLSNTDIAINKKIRFGSELCVAGFGSDALFALRTGYNYAGASFGAGINVGLLSFQYSNHAEDLGIGNARVTERRSTAIFVVNVAEN